MRLLSRLVTEPRTHFRCCLETKGPSTLRGEPLDLVGGGGGGHCQKKCMHKDVKNKNSCKHLPAKIKILQGSEANLHNMIGIDCFIKCHTPNSPNSTNFSHKIISWYNMSITLYGIFSPISQFTINYPTAQTGTWFIFEIQYRSIYIL